MATTTKAAAPAKKSGFQGVKAAWIILAICCAAGYGVWYFVMGNPDNFIGGDRSGHPANLLGTVYKGGFVVGLILTLLFTVICLGIERFFAIKTAAGKINLAKFTADVKSLIKAQKFDEADKLCDKMQGSVANVVKASIKMYQTVESDTTLKKAAKIAKIQQAHDEATQLEMPTLQMNMPMLKQKRRSMTPGLNINMSEISDFNISFLVDVGKTRWFKGEEKQSDDFLSQNLKSTMPKNKIFLINSLIFNITKHKREILTKYKCYYDEGTNSLNILITQDLCFADFTKEIMINLLDLARKVGIETIYFLVAKKNEQYIKIVQDLMIVGFELDEKNKSINIDGNAYKVLKLSVKEQDEEIEEIFL